MCILYQEQQEIPTIQVTDERGQDQQIVGVVEARGINDGESMSQSSLDLAEVYRLVTFI